LRAAGVPFRRQYAVQLRYVRDSPALRDLKRSLHNARAIFHQSIVASPSSVLPLLFRLTPGGLICFQNGPAVFF
jgi:hypothetical protein